MVLSVRSGKWAEVQHETEPFTMEKLSAIDEWWDNRIEIKDKKLDDPLSDTWKSQCVSIGAIIDKNYDLDFCCFPNEENSQYN